MGQAVLFLEPGVLIMVQLQIQALLDQGVLTDAMETGHALYSKGVPMGGGVQSAALVISGCNSGHGACWERELSQETIHLSSDNKD